MDVECFQYQNEGKKKKRKRKYCHSRVQVLRKALFDQTVMVVCLLISKYNLKKSSEWWPEHYVKILSPRGEASCTNCKEQNNSSSQVCLKMLVSGMSSEQTLFRLPANLIEYISKRSNSIKVICRKKTKSVAMIMKWMLAKCLRKYNILQGLAWEKKIQFRLRKTDIMRQAKGRSFLSLSFTIVHCPFFFFFFLCECMKNQCFQPSKVNFSWEGVHYMSSFPTWPSGVMHWRLLLENAFLGH